MFWPWRCARGRHFEPEVPRTAYVLGDARPAKMTPPRQRVIEIASDGLARSVSALAQEANVTPAVVRGLIDANTLVAVELPEFTPFEIPDPGFAKVVLSLEQEAAARSMKAAVAAKPLFSQPS